MVFPSAWLTSVALAASLAAAQLPDRGGQSPQDLADRAEGEFAAGHLEEAVASFDRLAALVPEIAPVLWQRGIALYELGRYRECAAQFRSFFDVDAHDLENATWYFLCQARATSPAEAQAGVLAAGPDPRVLRTEIYEMVRGHLSPPALMDIANTSVALVRFYAHVYVGFYLEATGRPAEAREHFVAAASDEYREEGGFLNVVVHGHLQRLTETAAGSASPKP